MSQLKLFGTVTVCTDLTPREITSNGKTTWVMNFLGKYVERIKNKTTDGYDYIHHAFSFEIWDSAAKFLADAAKKGDKIVILDATPREAKWEVEGQQKSKIVFRVNKFELCTPPPNSTEPTAESTSE